MYFNAKEKKIKYHIFVRVAVCCYFVLFNEKGENAVISSIACLRLC